MVISPDSFSIRPDADVTASFKNLFDTLEGNETSKTLTLRPGAYVVRAKNAAKCDFFADAALSCRRRKGSKLLRAGIYMKNICNLEWDGGGSTVIIDGKTAGLVLKDCENVTLKNMVLDCSGINVHKITVLKASPFFMTFRLDGGEYGEENERFFWRGRDHKLGFTEFDPTRSMICSPVGNRTHFEPCVPHPLAEASTIHEIAPRVFRVRFTSPKDFSQGEVFYVFPTDESCPAILLKSCKNISFRHMTVNFSRADSFAALDCTGVVLEGMNFLPRSEREEKLASPGDLVRFMMCRGGIDVEKSYFEGSGGNAVTVGGLLYESTETENDNVTVRSLAGSEGCIRGGDTVALLDRRDFSELLRCRVLLAETRAEGCVRLVLSEKMPAGKNFFLENVSACPDFRFRSNTLNSIGRCGVKLSAHGNMTLEGNKFLNTGETGLLIRRCDALELMGGRPEKTAVRSNAFLNCGPFSLTITSGGRPGKSVNSNAVIENNLFVCEGKTALKADSAEEIHLKGNVFKGAPRARKWIESENAQIEQE